MSGNSYEFIDGNNGQSEEFEGRVMFNLFINELPSVVKKFVWFVGGDEVWNCNIIGPSHKQGY